MFVDVLTNISLKEVMSHKTPRPLRRSSGGDSYAFALTQKWIPRLPCVGGPFSSFFGPTSLSPSVPELRAMKLFSLSFRPVTSMEAFPKGAELPSPLSTRCLFGLGLEVGLDFFVGYHSASFYFSGVTFLGQLLAKCPYLWHARHLNGSCS